jgi:hypothetical protein
VRVLEVGVAAQDLDLHAAQEVGHERDLVLDHEVLAREQLRDRDLLALQAQVDAVEAALAVAREVQRRLAQRLRGQRAGVDPRAADVLEALDQGDLLAAPARLDGGHHAGGAGADDGEVVVVGRHASPPA